MCSGWSRPRAFSGHAMGVPLFTLGTGQNTAACGLLFVCLLAEGRGCCCCVGGWRRAGCCGCNRCLICVARGSLQALRLAHGQTLLVSLLRRCSGHVHATAALSAGLLTVGVLSHLADCALPTNSYLPTDRTAAQLKKYSQSAADLAVSLTD